MKKQVGISHTSTISTMLLCAEAPLWTCSKKLQINSRSWRQLPLNLTCHLNSVLWFKKDYKRIKNMSLFFKGLWILSFQMCPNQSKLVDLLFGAKNSTYCPTVGFLWIADAPYAAHDFRRTFALSRARRRR